MRLTTEISTRYEMGLAFGDVQHNQQCKMLHVLLAEEFPPEDDPELALFVADIHGSAGDWVAAISDTKPGCSILFYRPAAAMDIQKWFDDNGLTL